MWFRWLAWRQRSRTRREKKTHNHLLRVIPTLLFFWLPAREFPQVSITSTNLARLPGSRPECIQSNLQLYNLLCYVVPAWMAHARRRSAVGRSASNVCPATSWPRRPDRQSAGFHADSHLLKTGGSTGRPTSPSCTKPPPRTPSQTQRWSTNQHLITTPDNSMVEPRRYLRWPVRWQSTQLKPIKIY